MLNETLQWVALLTTLFFLFGLYRQLGTYMGQSVASLSDAGGPRLNRRLPNTALEQLRRTLGDPLPTHATVAFVTEGCIGCQALLADVERLARKSPAPLHESGFRIALVALRPSPAFLQALHDLGVPVVDDADGKLWAECDIQATPFVVTLDARGSVLSKEVTHHVTTHGTPAAV